jgi:hypothetical protein
MIIVQFDHQYYHWGRLMLCSLALHEPAHKVFADTVNLLPEQQAELQRLYPYLIVKNTVVPAAHVSKEWMANRKAFVMQNAMTAYPDEPWYGLFDVDFLIRRPLSDLWSCLANYPTALLLTNGMWKGRFYPRLVTVSSIVLVRPDGRALIDNWAKWYFYEHPMDSIQPRAWFWDQLTLLQAWCETQLPYAIIPIHMFADANLSATAAVWSANVQGKQYCYELFQQEYERQQRSRSLSLP